MTMLRVGQVVGWKSRITHCATAHYRQDRRGEARAAVVRAVMTLLLATLWASHSEAQEAAGSFEDLGELIEIGAVIYIDDDSGDRLKGRLEELSAASLTIQTEGNVRRRRQFSSSQVTQISRVDSRLSGFLIGLGVGAVSGALVGSLANSYCENESTANNSCTAGATVLGAIIAAGSGWIGWTIDGSIDGETPVFERVNSGGTLRLTPTVTREGSALTISLEF